MLPPAAAGVGGELTGRPVQHPEAEKRVDKPFQAHAGLRAHASIRSTARSKSSRSTVKGTAAGTPSSSGTGDNEPQYASDTYYETAQIPTQRVVTEPLPPVSEPWRRWRCC